MPTTNKRNCDCCWKSNCASSKAALRLLSKYMAVWAHIKTETGRTQNKTSRFPFIISSNKKLARILASQPQGRSSQMSSTLKISPLNRTPKYPTTIPKILIFPSTTTAREPTNRNCRTKRHSTASEIKCCGRSKSSIKRSLIIRWKSKDYVWRVKIVNKLELSSSKARQSGKRLSACSGAKGLM